MNRVYGIAVNRRYLFFVICMPLPFQLHAMKRSGEEVVPAAKKVNETRTLYDEAVMERVDALVNRWRFKDDVRKNNIPLQRIVALSGLQGSGKSILSRYIIDNIGGAACECSGEVVLVGSINEHSVIIPRLLGVGLEKVFQRLNEMVSDSNNRILRLTRSQLFMFENLNFRDLAIAAFRTLIQNAQKKNLDLLILLEFDTVRDPGIHFLNEWCDWTIWLDPPGDVTRGAILKHHMNRISIAISPDVAPDRYRDRTRGFLPGSLERLVDLAATEAIVRAASAGSETTPLVTSSDFDKAFTTLAIQPEPEDEWLKKHKDPPSYFS